MKAESQANKAYTEMRRKIIGGQIIPETRLKEDFWAKKLVVSRMAVREALTRLLGESLVTLGAKGGYFVSSLAQADIDEFKELREILELGAMQYVVKRITKDQLQRLEKICNDFTSMVEQGYFSGACEADLKFHEMIMESSGNSRLYQAYINSHIPLYHQHLTKFSITQESEYLLTDKEHRGILQAIKEKNLEQSIKAMKFHLDRGIKVMKENSMGGS